MAKYRATYFHLEDDQWVTDVIIEWEGFGMTKARWDTLIKYQLLDCISYYSDSYLLVTRDGKQVMRAAGNDLFVHAEHAGSKLGYFRMFDHSLSWYERMNAERRSL